MLLLKTFDAPNWKELKCLSMVTKYTDCGTGVLVNNKKLLIHAVIWTNLKDNLPNKRARPKRLYPLWFHFYDILGKMEL